MTRTTTGVIVFSAILASTAPLHAHVTFAEPSAKAGSYYAGFLRVSHGCAESPTISVRVAIPDGIVIARPQPKPGWSVSIEKAPLAKPAAGEGGALVHERVTAIVWSGRLPADQFDQFGIMVKLPDAAGTLYFPTVQTCAVGRADWTAVPIAGASGRSANPAPRLDVTPGVAAAMDHMAM